VENLELSALLLCLFSLLGYPANQPANQLISKPTNQAASQLAIHPSIYLSKQLSI